MSVYNRRGGSKTTKSLKQQFNYYKKQFLNRLVKEQALKLARTGGGFERLPKTLFERLDYQSIVDTGITRKVGNKTVRYTGDEAIKVQIESLKRRSSARMQNEIFIYNYCKALDYIDMPFNMVDDIRDKLNSLASDRLAILIDKGVLPQIAFLYSKVKDYEDLYDEIMNAIDKGLARGELKQLRSKRKEYEKLIKQQLKIEGLK